MWYSGRKDAPQAAAPDLVAPSSGTMGEPAWPAARRSAVLAGNRGDVTWCLCQARAVHPLAGVAISGDGIRWQRGQGNVEGERGERAVRASPLQPPSPPQPAWSLLLCRRAPVRVPRPLHLLGSQQVRQAGAATAECPRVLALLLLSPVCPQAADVGASIGPSGDWWTFDTHHVSVSDVQVRAASGEVGLRAPHSGSNSLWDSCVMPSSSFLFLSLSFVRSFRCSPRAAFSRAWACTGASTPGATTSPCR